MNKKINIEIPQGDTPTVVSPISTSDSSPFDGSTAQGFYVIAASNASGATIYLTKKTSDGSASFNLNSATGEWELWAPLTAADTKSLPPTGNSQPALYHEAAVIEASGARSTGMSGAVTVIPTVIMENLP
jgi:hypothetical protein